MYLDIILWSEQYLDITQEKIMKMKAMLSLYQFFKIQLQSLIYNIVCLASTSYALAVLLCCLLRYSSI